MAHRAGFVNIVGNPNVGKSTLMNALVGERLSIITSKAPLSRSPFMSCQVLSVSIDPMGRRTIFAGIELDAPPLPLIRRSNLPIYSEPRYIFINSAFQFYGLFFALLGYLIIPITNSARDRGWNKLFKWLHNLSVFNTIVIMIIAIIQIFRITTL